MRSRVSPWRLRADDLLADGYWHSFDEVRREVGKSVPPGVALRRTEAMRSAQERYQRSHGESPRYAEAKGRVVARSLDYLLHVGRQRIGLDVLRNGVKANAYETKSDEHGKRWIRMVHSTSVGEQAADEQREEPSDG